MEIYMMAVTKICSIISIIIATIKLALIGNLSQGTVIFIMASGVLILIGNKKVFIITTAVCGLILFIKLYGGSPASEFALLQSILTLTLVCYGIYIILRGVVGKSPNN